MRRSPLRPVLFFYLLAAYVVLQFGWWAYYLIQINRELRDISIAFSPDESHRHLLAEAFERKTWMILGECLVFILFLGIGIRQVKKYMVKEAGLGRLQTNFLLSVNHEIKSPLTSIRLMMETLIRRELPEESRKELASSAMEEVDRLDMLSDKILLAARIESTRQAFYLQPLDLSALLEASLQRLRAHTGAAHPTSVEIEEGLRVMGDSQALDSLIGNLYENAVKYSPTGSDILVRLHRNGQEVWLIIEDRGPGISPHDRSRIFGKFYRSGSEETRKTKGTGLGLYLVKQIATIHGADVLVESATPRGTRFIIRFKKTA